MMNAVCVKVRETFSTFYKTPALAGTFGRVEASGEVGEAVLYFDKFRAYRKRTNFDEAISYGVGLCLMFCGPSGTGKTMTANAIAAMLRKKLLLRLLYLRRGMSNN